MEGLAVVAVASVDEWRAISHEHTPPQVAICFASEHRNANDTIVLLSEALTGSALVVVSDRWDAFSVRAALNSGASGIIPTEATLDVAVAALRLIRAGGTFVPADALTAPARLPARRSGSRRSRPATPPMPTDAVA